MVITLILLLWKSTWLLVLFDPQHMCFAKPLKDYGSSLTAAYVLFCFLSKSRRHIHLCKPSKFYTSCIYCIVLLHKLLHTTVFFKTHVTFIIIVLRNPTHYSSSLLFFETHVALLLLLLVLFFEDPHNHPWISFFIFKDPRNFNLLF